MMGVEERELVAARRHWDPHHVLGARPVEGGVVVRAFRPDAREVLVRAEGGESLMLEQRHRAGLFEGLLHGAGLPLRYELEVSYADGNVYTFRDAYAFAPTLGDVDLHLVGEGRYELLYEQLGAHVREIDGALGTSFAVWAPAAQAVSVVGEFNSWDGRLHAMRVLGGSGVWEIFIPGVEEGAAYKFEILTQGGDIRLKADPFAFAHGSDAAHRLGRAPLASRLAGRGVDGATAGDEAARSSDVDLRGPLGVVAAQPRGGQPVTALPGAG